MGLHFGDLVNIDDGRAVNPLQYIGVQFRLEFLHGLAHDVCFAAGMDTHVVARSIDPFNLVLWHQGGAAGILDDQFGNLFFLQPVDALGAQFPHAAYVFPGHVTDQTEQGFLVFQSMFQIQVFPYAKDCFVQAIVLDGLEQVVKRIGLERLDGIFIECSNKHDGGHIFLLEFRKYIETAHTGHLDIQENKIRLQFSDALQGLPPVLCFRYDCEIVYFVEPVLQSTAGQRLVVDNDGPEHVFTD